MYLSFINISLLYQRNRITTLIEFINSLSMNKYPNIRAQEHHRIMIQELMFAQMKENLGQNITECVQSTRKLLLQVGPVRSKKIILGVQRNLHNFMRRGHKRQLRSGNQSISNFRNSDLSEEFIRPKSIFNIKLLKQQLKKTEQPPEHNRHVSILRKQLISANKKIFFQKPADNIILQKKQRECYSARHHTRRKSENIFNLVMNR